MPTRSDAVQYANSNYYSKQMTQLNLKCHTFISHLSTLSFTPKDYEFHVRGSLVLLHALAVMELIHAPVLINLVQSH